MSGDGMASEGLGQIEMDTHYIQHPAFPRNMNAQYWTRHGHQFAVRASISRDACEALAEPFRSLARLRLFRSQMRGQHGRMNQG
jgi:hypothetical protein